MNAPVPRAKHPAQRHNVQPGLMWSLDPLTAVGLVCAVLFAGGIGGWLWAGLLLAVSLVFVNYARHSAIQAANARMQQENVDHFLMQNASPEDIAKLRSGSEIAEKNLVDFLTALKETYGGGESVRGTGRLASDEQTEAVAPGITMTLAHDLGWWYAKLVLSGETGRQFLHGEYTQYKGRGRTPQEAIDAMVRRAGAARQQRMIQEYAARLVADDD
jgi:hypothetical protein